jgi:hypothetical protein
MVLLGMSGWGQKWHPDYGVMIGPDDLAGWEHQLKTKTGLAPFRDYTNRPWPLYSLAHRLWETQKPKGTNVHFPTLATPPASHNSGQSQHSDNDTGDDFPESQSQPLTEDWEPTQMSSSTSDDQDLASTNDAEQVCV